MIMDREPLVRFEHLTRRFGELAAVSDVSLDIRAGEVLALLGENGAGKSTLMKLLYGIHPPSAGRILLDGRESPIRGPADAMRNGIGMVFQHFSLLPALSVRDNLLAAWPATPAYIGRRSKRAARVLDRLSVIAPDIDPERRVDTLSVGEQQLVELCKVVNLEARVVILDEPTSVLTPAEAQRLYDFVLRLAAEGRAVVLITHKLADVEACADRIAVMRGGMLVADFAKGERTTAETVALMMGRPAATAEPAPDRFAGRPARLVLREITASAAGHVLKGISLEIAGGEVLGIAGVAGNGQTLLAEVVAGVEAPSGGDVLLDGESIARRGDEPHATPIGYIPEQPRDNAVVETMDLSANLRLRALAAGEADGAYDVAALIRRFNIAPSEPTRRAGTLSGGNLQKLVAARELGVPRPAVLACYPTMGLDLGAVGTVYEAMFAQAAAGAAVLWISEDLDDLLARAHRIAVMRGGAIVALVENDGTLTRDRLGAFMTGAPAEAAA
ncbi:simple sugar transport system ATP-binding protein [Kaistia soli DSM 19436]|uniref:Simple sugar transport system ATP-binding protein n=1 Tax=Kaistia soli DSM 19436 TaxID=1122133 RepID=A0A1M5ICN4_9HYPH|nr:ATP-binding cassette domain-containing protein [Kaistia soli]SHG25660.1 simple sugar transport system ATP-binding protein [Kaistia soli DSM 19436]